MKRNALLEAWETTVDDVEHVLVAMKEDVALAPELFLKLDREAIAKAALDGDGMDQQIDYAYEEIRRQINLSLK
jgi:hypothetical protein